MRFQVAGDTGGVKFAQPQQHVADAMEADFSGGSQPAFFYHLGDVVYFFGEGTNYYDQFYDPYVHYPAPIFAIPGNHDGDVQDPSVSTLAAFVRNFCSATPQVSPDAGEAPRQSMTQPNVYWTLDSPFVTLVGLYSNVPEGGAIHQDQVDWLVSELKSAPADKALVLSLHHPPFSADAHHAGSLSMVELLDGAFQNAGRTPDAVFAGHVHNYQRFTREMNSGVQVPYIVAGAGGYWHLHTMQRQPDGSQLQVPFTMTDPGLTLENYSTMHGYLLMQASDGLIHGDYYAVPSTAQPTPVPAQKVDSFDLDTKHHQVTRSAIAPLS